MLLFVDERECKILSICRADNLYSIIDRDDLSRDLDRRVCPDRVVKIGSDIIDNHSEEGISGGIVFDYNVKHRG